MADLNDVWNWPNDGANGYATDSNDWKDDNSAGISQRVNNVLTYVYKQHQTNNLHYTNDLSRTRDVLNRGFAAYKHYHSSHSDDKHPTFNMLARYPQMEFSIRPNGRTIGGIHYELNSSTKMPQIRVQFTSAHEFGTGDEIEFYGFENDSTGRNDRRLNTKRAYVSIVDGFSVVLHEDSALTKLEQISEMGFFAQSDIFFTMLDDGTGSEDAVVHFDGFAETLVTGDTMTIADPFVNLTGTVAGASGTVYYLEKISNNSYKLFTNSGRTTNATITSGQGKDKFASPASGGIPFSIASSGSAATIAVNLSDSSFNSLKANIESQNMTPETSSEDTTNIFRGFCRVELTAGTGTSKAIPSSMGDTAFFGYKYTKSTGALEILTDPCGAFGARDASVLTATNGSGNITGNIKIIDYWSYRVESPGTYASASSQTQIVPTNGTNVGGMYFFGTVNDTSLNPLTPLTHPLASEKGTLYQGNKTSEDDNTNFDKLIYHIASTNCRSPGRKSYFYKNSSNVDTAGAVYDFTKFWRPGQSSHFTPTYITTPTATPNVNSSGFLTGTTALDVFPARGLFTLAGLGLTSSVNIENTAILSGSPAKPATHTIEKVGLFPINAKADEYVTPTPYAPDVFDTDDEWATNDLNDARDWPTVVAPNGVKFTQVIPSSVTKSQNGTKYVRDSGIIRHQLEVSYPPMTEDNFRHFEAVSQAARGQAVPFFFELVATGDLPPTPGGLFWRRTDTENSNLNLGTGSELKIVTPVAVGDAVFTLEGFEASKTKAFIRGECIIISSAISKNGHIVHVINDNVTTNKFGEAKIRVAMGSPNLLRGSATSGDQSKDSSSVFKNPFHLVVTLAEDSFEYEKGTDGLYRFTCRFDLDNFK